MTHEQRRAQERLKNATEVQDGEWGVTAVTQGSKREWRVLFRREDPSWPSKQDRASRKQAGPCCRPREEPEYEKGSDLGGRQSS